VAKLEQLDMILEPHTFFCLLADDKLITKVSMETDQLLEFAGSSPNDDDVRLVITVRLRPYEMHLGNIQYG